MKLTKAEIDFNSELIWFKRKGWLSEKGLKFAENHNEYIKDMLKAERGKIK